MRGQRSVILLDPRSGSGPLQSHIPSKFRVVSCYLDSADAMFIGNGPRGKVECGIEVKHLSDLLQSMEDGRLPISQTMSMREQYDYVFLLLHDTVRADQSGTLQVWVPHERNKERGDNSRYNHFKYWDKRGKWCDATFGIRRRLMFSDYLKWITSLSVCGGVRYLSAGSNQEAGEALGAMYEWFHKEWGEHNTFQAFDDSTHAPTLIRPSLAMEHAHKLVQGVGWEKAIAASECGHLNTPRKQCNATVEDWMQVPGVGRVIAERAVRAATTVHARREVRRK
jgi:hypothetical protein